jgi:hypothetical protein
MVQIWTMKLSDIANIIRGAAANYHLTALAIELAGEISTAVKDFNDPVILAYVALATMNILPSLALLAARFQHLTWFVSPWTSEGALVAVSLGLWCIHPFRVYAAILALGSIMNMHGKLEPSIDSAKLNQNKRIVRHERQNNRRKGKRK